MTRNLIAKLAGTADGMPSYWSEFTFALAEIRNYHLDGEPYSTVLKREADFWTSQAKGAVAWKLERASRRLRRVASQLEPSIPADEVANFVTLLTDYRTEQDKSRMAPPGSGMAVEVFSAGMEWQRRVSDTA